ncbi:hypothetical protein GS518_02920 [Leptospira interrogans]|nr:hypothetical protein [Leptospira interrogans serovar Copenhageni]QHH27353.1 hypothetical protein GS520_02905 [Leptospira interrogans]QHH31003.1 hypothetical protein GS525_02945 [Leptospira interrogans]QHH34638.1 hypothetical protein GS519_02945 [Leptospira interrogans]QHH38271.1 hypothetical protein GS526_02940 [Leptospira interrogans]
MFCVSITFAEFTFYYIVLSRLVFNVYFEFIVNLTLYVVVPTTLIV